VGHQPRLARLVRPRVDGGGRHTLEPAQHALDLGDLHAVPADLDRLVSAPHVGQAAVGTQHAPISRPVEPRGPAGGIGEECGGGELGPAPVAERQVRAADDDLADLAGPDIAPGLVPDQDGLARRGIAHRHAPVARLILRDHDVAAEGERLRRPHGMPERAPGGKAAAEPPQVIARDGLPAEAQGAQGRESMVVGQRVEEAPVRGGRCVQQGEPLVPDPRGERFHARAARSYGQRVAPPHSAA